MTPPPDPDADLDAFAPPGVLPGVLGEIAAAVGAAEAAAVAAHLGGQYVWLSAEPGPRSPLARVLGVEGARAVAAALGPNQKIVIPCGGFAGEAGRRRRIAELLAEGRAHGAVAAAVGVHVRTVERVAASLRPDPEQPGLFD